MRVMIAQWLSALQNEGAGVFYFNGNANILARHEKKKPHGPQEHEGFVFVSWGAKGLYCNWSEK